MDAGELQTLGSFAGKWWNESGPVKALHSMNSVRVPFIREGLIATEKINASNINTNKVLEGVKILEVGCGGGILTESLARLHGEVVGIDPGIDVLQVAIEHSAMDPTVSPFIVYRNETIEDHIKENEGKYDAVVVSEVIEHVVNKELFLEACCKAVNKNGSLFLTTLNRTTFSWLGAIVVAENILNLVPKNTHDWDKFIQPVEIQRILEKCKLLLCVHLIILIKKLVLRFFRRNDNCFSEWNGL